MPVYVVHASLHICIFIHMYTHEFKYVCLCVCTFWEGKCPILQGKLSGGELSGGELSWWRQRSVPHAEESPRSCTFRLYVHVSLYFCKTTSRQSPSLRRCKQVYFLLFHLLWRQSKRSVFWCKFHSNVVYFTNN